MMNKSATELFSGAFSILAISHDPKLMGVATVSGSTHVGDRVLHAKPGIGVIATQAYTNITYGTKGLELPTQGLTPQEALSRLLKEDAERKLRQVAIMNFEKEKAAFSGQNVSKYAAEIAGENYVVIGNLFSRREVGFEIAKQFESSSEDLGLSLVKALKAGSESGGDKGGEKSAAILIVSKKNVEINIRIDSNETPVDKLLRKLIAK